MYPAEHQIENAYTQFSDGTGNLYIGQSSGKKIANALLHAEKTIRIFSYNIGLSSIITDSDTFPSLTVKDLLEKKIIVDKVQVTLALDNSTLKPEDKNTLSHLYISQNSNVLSDNVASKEAQLNACYELHQKNDFIGRMLYLLFLIVPIAALGYIFFEQVDPSFIFINESFFDDRYIPLFIDLFQQVIILAIIIASLTIACVFTRSTIIKYINRNYTKLLNAAHCIPIRSFDYQLRGDLLLVNYNKDRFHAKIYIIDDEIAFVGSPNFTSNGFYKNYECRVEITDSAAIEDLVDKYDKIIASIKEKHMHTPMNILVKDYFAEDFYS